MPSSRTLPLRSFFFLTSNVSKLAPHAWSSHRKSGSFSFVQVPIFAENCNAPNKDNYTKLHDAWINIFFSVFSTHEAIITSGLFVECDDNQSICIKAPRQNAVGYRRVRKHDYAYIFPESDIRWARVTVTSMKCPEMHGRLIEIDRRHQSSALIHARLKSMLPIGKLAPRKGNSPLIPVTSLIKLIGLYALFFLLQLETLTFSRNRSLSDAIKFIGKYLMIDPIN